MKESVQRNKDSNKLLGRLYVGITTTKFISSQFHLFTSSITHVSHVYVYRNFHLITQRTVPKNTFVALVRLLNSIQNLNLNDVEQLQCASFPHILKIRNIHSVSIHIFAGAWSKDVFLWRELWMFVRKLYENKSRVLWP